MRAAIITHGYSPPVFDPARYFKNLVICKFEGIDTPEAMRLYKTADIFVDRKDATPLKEGEHYIADLIGLNVLTEEGEPLGIVENIFPTGANQVMEVKRLEGSLRIGQPHDQGDVGHKRQKGAEQPSVLRGRHSTYIL